MSSNSDAATALQTRNAVALPDGTDTATSLQFDPSYSLVVVPDEVGTELGEAVGVLHFPVILAGQYAQSPVTEILGTLSQRAQYELRRGGADERAIERSAARFVAIEQVTQTLTQEYVPAIQTLTAWSLRRLLSEHEFIEMFATDYATENADVNPNTIVDACDRLRQAAEADYANPQLAGILDGVAQTHSRRAANIIADLTLRPRLDDVLNTDPMALSVEAMESFSVTERCRRLADTLERTITDPDEHDAVMLEQSLIEESPVAVYESQTWTERELPTQQAPWRVRDTESFASNSSEFVGYPTGIAWLLTKAFTEGAIGGIAYPRAAGDMSWLVNPWAEPADDSQSYRHAWSRAIVTDQILDCLFRQAEAGQWDPASVGCPFCAVSADCCGGDECGHADYLESVRDEWTDLCAAVAARYD